MGFLRTPRSLVRRGVSLGVGLGVDVARAVGGRLLPGERSGDDALDGMPPDVAPAGGPPGVLAPDPPPSGPPPPPPPGARPAPPPFDPPPIPDAESEVVAEVGDPHDVGASVHVEGEPFPGYDALQAPEIVARLHDADESTRAMVRLYERATKGRRTVLDATER